MADHVTPQEFSRGWYEQMTRIWSDRIRALGIYDTGSLLASVQGTAFQADELTMTAAFRFVQYGLYVDRGTGKYYDDAHRDEKGQLSFLDPTERRRAGRNKPRQARPWFSVSWGISRRVITEHYARVVGEAFSVMLDELGA